MVAIDVEPCERCERRASDEVLKAPERALAGCDELVLGTAGDLGAPHRSGRTAGVAVDAAKRSERLGLGR